MAKELIRLMQSLFLPAAERCQDVLWHPALDVYQTRSGWLLKFDLAGVRIEDVSLCVCGSRLTVRGRRRDWFATEGHNHYLMEIAYSDF
jgi:HSP20 family protein